MLDLMKKMNGAPCSCGKVHTFDADIYSGVGAIKNLAPSLKKLGASRVFVLADSNTYAVGGDAVEKILKGENIPFTKFIYQSFR